MPSSPSLSLLSLVVLAPLAAAALLLVVPAHAHRRLRAVALGGTLVTLCSCALAFARFDPAGPEFQLELRLRWLDSVGASFHLGVDGLAVALVLLTGLLGPLVVLGAWSFVGERVREFHVALLVLQAATLGAVCSLDALLFFGCFELTLLPMALLIGVWGAEERQRAATQFLLFGLLGSQLLLVGLLGAYVLAAPAGERSFDYATLVNGLQGLQREVAACTAAGDCSGASPRALALLRYGPWLFLAFTLAFAIKVPLFPLHSWMGDAYVQAPGAASVLLALKLGTFGFWRFAVPLFPAQARAHQVALCALALTGVLVGSLLCLAQRDLKRLLAYASVAHLGLSVLGMFAFTPEGASGSALTLLNQGISTGALLLLFGFLDERRRARRMTDYGGLAKVMPVFATFFVVATLSSIAVPGSNGFVGEVLLLLGTFKSQLPVAYGLLAGTSMVLGAAAMLWMVQRVFFGPVTHRENLGLLDLSPREVLAAAPLLAAMLLLGVRPQPVLDVLSPSAQRYLARASGSAAELVQVSVLPLPPLPEVAPRALAAAP